MTPDEWAQGAWLLSIAAAAVVVLRLRGLLSRHDFDATPPRRGSLGVADLAVTGGLFILGPPLVMAVLFGEPVTPRDSASDMDALLRQMLASQGGMALAVVYLLLRADSAVEGGIAGLGLPLRRLPRSIGHAVLAFFAIFPIVGGVSAVVLGLLLLLGTRPPVIAHDVLEVLVVEPYGPAWWGLVVSAAVLAPVVEELIFRGMVQTALLHSGVTRTRWSAITVTSLLFATIHLSVAPPHVLPALYTLSLGLGWVYERWGSLWTPIFLHALFNTSQILIGLLVTSNALPPPAYDGGMERAPQITLLAAVVAAAGCSAPRVQTTRLGSADLTAMSDAMAESLLASRVVEARPDEADPMVIVIDRAVNRTQDVIPQRELWSFLARLQAQLAESPRLRARGVRLVLPAERAAELNVREGDDGFSEHRRVPPTHALTATFYSATTASRKLRSDAYLCHFQMIDLHTDALTWQDRYEVKYAVMRNKLD